jgi:phosphoglycolate phosphatase
VLQEAGTAARDSIYIGDELRDAEAARRTGVAFGAVTWGFAAPEALRAEAPDATFSTFDDIVRLIAPG